MEARTLALGSLTAGAELRLPFSYPLYRHP
jgi:hypothetical protein